MKTAVIKTGGKQYLVQEGSRIKVEKLPAEEGSEFKFEEVLLVNEGDKLEIGEPLVSGASVSGKVLAQARHKKVWGVKMKPKKRQRKLFGHKQPYTEIEIAKISTK